MTPEMFHRPGPNALPPGEQPDGIVFHVYSVPTNRLLLVSHLHSLDQAASVAEQDADRVKEQLWPDDVGSCLVAYDGDTGERIELRDILGVDEL